MQSKVLILSCTVAKMQDSPRYLPSIPTSYPPPLKFALAHNVAITCLQPLHCLTHHLINYLLRRLLLIHNRSNLAHQEGSRIIQRIVIDVIPQPLHIILNGDLAPRREFLDFLGAIVFPVVDVWVLAHSERTSSEDDGSDVIVEASGSDSLLVSLWRAGLLGQDEAGANPDGAGAEHERGGERLTIEDATCGDDLDLLAGIL